MTAPTDTATAAVEEPAQTAIVTTIKSRQRSHAVVEKAPAPPPKIELTAPEWYLNRELTWLEFNRRVLHEGQDERTPLLERVKFLAIVSSNLDEFFMKRIGGLKQQVGAGVKELSIDGRTPEQQIRACHVVARELEEQQRLLAKELHVLLIQQGIRISSYGRLTPSSRSGSGNIILKTSSRWSPPCPWTRRIPFLLSPTCR